MMDREDLDLNDPKIQKSLALTDKNKIRAMFTSNRDADFIKSRIAFFNLDPNPIFEDEWGALYIKK